MQSGLHRVFVLLDHIDLVVQLREPLVAFLGKLELNSRIVAVLPRVLLEYARGRLLRLLVNIERPMHVLFLLPVADVGVVALGSRGLYCAKAAVDVLIVHVVDSLRVGQAALALLQVFDLVGYSARNRPEATQVLNGQLLLHVAPCAKAEVLTRVQRLSRYFGSDR